METIEVKYSKTRSQFFEAITNQELRDILESSLIKQGFNDIEITDLDDNGKTIWYRYHVNKSYQASLYVFNVASCTIDDLYKLDDGRVVEPYMARVLITWPGCECNLNEAVAYIDLYQKMTNAAAAVMATLKEVEYYIRPTKVES
jgi:hypothetical protein